MIVVDTCVVIAWLDGEDAHHASATQFLLDNPSADLVVHPVTLAEILVGPTRAGKVDQVRVALLDVGFRTDLPDVDQPVRLAALRVGTGLKLPDCCVLDMALVHHAPLVTFDDRLTVVARERGLGLVTTG